ncbi:hypothetical protein [Flagellimonas onchidii]|uniref:hypothetical protein n=1 Tax=Flagellimonas onchidii TaxID=2562684 RepID=UPI0010A6A597|nr:hypothetical protein [Allomuricauda onchidii]
MIAKAKVCVGVLMILTHFSCEKYLNRSKKQATVYKEESGWIRIGPGGGGSTFIPTFSYHNEEDFFIRCDMTGAYHTKNGGSSFKEVNYPNGPHSFAYCTSSNESELV